MKSDLFLQIKGEYHNGVWRVEKKANQKLNKLKKTEMEILDYFVSICEKHHLTYYLSYGTLLGAIRHSGFIPWDDDIDVMMPPNDYLKFLSIIKKECDSKYFLQDIDTEKYYHTTFAKIRKKSTCMIEEEWQWIKIHKGINLDVFALYPFPDDKKDQKKFVFKLKLVYLLLSKNNRTKNLKNKIIFFLLRLIPRSVTNKYASKLNKELLTYNKKYSNYNLDMVTTYKKELFNGKTKMKFENKMYYVPNGYKEILTNMYGDYMKLPPEEARCGHGRCILSFDKEYEQLKIK